MGSLAAHRGDRAEATGLFHPLAHCVPLPPITYSILLPNAHLLCVSLDANLSLPFSSLSYLSFFGPASSCLHSLFLLVVKPTQVIFSESLHFILPSPTQPSSYTPPIVSSHLPLSLPCPPYVSPLDSHVRCCCAVDKTQSLSHPSCTLDPWLRFCVCMHVRKTVGERQKEKPQPEQNV